MRSRSYFGILCTFVVVAALAVTFGVSRAATIETSDDKRDPPATPPPAIIQGSVEPDLTVIVEEDELPFDIPVAMEALAEQIDSSQGYQAGYSHHNSHYDTVTVLEQGGAEVDNVSFSYTVATIKCAKVVLQRTGLGATLHPFVASEIPNGDPHGAYVTVIINGSSARQAKVFTSTGMNPATLTALLIAKIQSKGYVVKDMGSAIEITEDSVTGAPITQLELCATDTGIYSGYVALAPLY